MLYETSAQMAERLGVNPRTVQIWAKEGKLAGAKKQGRDWLIPFGMGKPDKNASVPVQDKMPYPFYNSAFASGQALEYIDTIEGEDLKHLAKAEYWYLTGNPKAAAEATEEFFNHNDLVVKISACYIYGFSNLAIGNTHMARLSFDCIGESLREEVPKDVSTQFKSAIMLVESALKALMHIPVSEEFTGFIKYLPEGLKAWAGYLLAHEAFYKGDCNKALGIIEMSLAFTEKQYPIPVIYLNLASAMCYMALKNTEKAEEKFYEAWEFAQKDNIIMPFVTHQGLLYGLVEKCLKYKEPEKFKEITKLATVFSKSWRKVHNERTNKSITVELTTTEFAISMLASRGWSNTEIADYMHFSLHTVKRHISIVYQKLAISSRSELSRFMH